MAQELNHFIIKTSRCAALRFFGGSFRFSVSSCSVQLQRPASSELSVPSYDKSTSARPLSSPCFLYLVRPLKSSYVAIRTLPLFCVQLQRPASSELSVPSYDKSTSARPLSSPCFLYLVRPLKSSYVAIRTLPLFCVQLQRPASSELSVPSYDKSTSARPLSSPCFLYLVRPLKSSYVAIRTLPLFCVLVCSANYMLVYLFSPNLTREMIISYSNIINLCLLIVF
ncbi:hypothetical protein J2Z23_002543 [Lederbergia galactosidilyticus]|nr:hypothetical protein [Lederbergia galactosidilytica]